MKVNARRFDGDVWLRAIDLFAAIKDLQMDAVANEAKGKKYVGSKVIGLIADSIQKSITQDAEPTAQ